MPRRNSFAALALTTLAFIAAMALTGCNTAGGGVAGIAGPGGAGTGTNPPPSLNTAVYSLSLTGVASITSVSYDDGNGTLLTVSNPTSGWTVTVPVTRGASSVESHARGTLPGGASATLRASWQVPGEAPENEVETETNVNVNQSKALTLDVRKRAL